MRISRLFIDIGHGHANRKEGSFDPGATIDRWREHDFVANIAYGIQLAFIPPRVVLCPDNISLSKVVAWVNDHAERGDYFLSLHMNSGGGTGTETIYSFKAPLVRQEHARVVSAALAKDLGIRDRGPKIDTSTPNGRRGEPGLPIVRDTNIPALLIEFGFIDSADDRDAVRANGVSALRKAVLALEDSFE